MRPRIGLARAAAAGLCLLALTKPTLGKPAVSADSRASRLAALISKTNPKEPKPREFATAIRREAKRHGLPVAHLAAVAWVESHFNRKAKGKAREHGAFQVMEKEWRIADQWNWLRAHPAGFPLALKWGAIPWGKLGRQRVKVLRSIEEGTFMAAALIRQAVVLCERSGHRLGKGYCRQTASGTRCVRRHRTALDRVAHWNSGPRWPYPGYLRKLRRRARQIGRILKGETR